MNYMKDFFDAQQKMYENFQKSYAQFTESKGESKNPMDEFFNTQKKWFESLNTEANPFAAYQKMMENPGFNVEAYKNFLDMQKLYFDNMDKMKEFYPKGLGMYDLSSFDFKNVNEAFNKYQEMFTDFDYSKYFAPQMSGVLEKMFNANKFYIQMYEFWNKLNQDYTGALETDVDKVKEYIQSNASAAFNLLLSSLPEEFRPYLVEPKELVNKYFNTMMDFYSPWKDQLNELKDMFVLGSLESDPEKLTDFFRLWKAKYDETFGKMVNSPSFGISRNIVEQQNKAFERFIDMFVIASEFSTKLNTVQTEAFKNIINEYVELAKEGKELKTFEEFFNFWSKKMDDRLVNYFGSEEFSKMLAQFGEATMDFKIESNKLLEQYLSDTPIVTEGQLDSMIKNVYDLKKEIKALKKEIESLKSNNKAVETK